MSTRTSRSNHAIDLTRDRLRVGFVRLGFDTPEDRFRQRRLFALPSRRGARARSSSFARACTSSARPDCGPAGTDCTRRRRRPAEPARGPVRRDRAALHHVTAKLRPVPEADARARRARSICVEAAAQLRGILGRQLHRRPRLRSRRAARRQGLRHPGRDPLRQPHSRQRATRRGRRLCLLGPCDGPQPRPADGRRRARSISIPSAAARGSISTASRSTPRSPSR